MKGKLKLQKIDKFRLIMLVSTIVIMIVATFTGRIEALGDLLIELLKTLLKL